MNIIDFFANGGKTRSQANEEGQAILEVLSSIGVQPEAAESVLTSLAEKNDVETMNIISEAVDTILNSQDMSQINDSKNILKNIFMESQIFKCGGKLQQLVTKFGKGGGVDCGCGGIKLNQQGGITGPFNKIPEGYYNENGVFLGYGNEPRTIEYINSRNNNRTWTVTHPTNLARFNNTINQSRMLWNPESLPEPYDVSSFTRLADGTVTTLKQNPSINRSNYVETKQEGGELTRRRARELATTNKGFNNAQFNLALANAKNALRQSGLRGKDLRTRALAMASGYSDQLPIVEPVGQRNNIDYGYVDGLVGSRPTREQLELKPITLEETPVITKQPVKRGVIDVEPIMDGYQDYLALKNAESAKETRNRVGYERARREEFTASRSNQLLTEDDSQFDITGQPALNWRGTRGTHNYIFNNTSDQRPTSTISEEINNSGYYRSSPEEIARRDQRWNEYWNKPNNRPQYQTIDETYEATPGYSTGSGISFGQRLKNFLTRGATGYSGGAGYSKN